MALEKKPFNRIGLVCHLLHQPDKSYQIHASNPPVDDRFELAGFAPGVEPANVPSGLGAHHGQHPLDRLQHARDPAERERRGRESHHLAIVRAHESPDYLNGIGGGIRIVEAGIEAVERGPQPGCLQGSICHR
jgi:hypothetical protein